MDDGALDGVEEGARDKEGAELGLCVGLRDRDGINEGNEDREGILEGVRDLEGC